MSIMINCVCGKKLNAKVEQAGKNVKCPSCGHRLTVPWPDFDSETDDAEVPTPRSPNQTLSSAASKPTVPAIETGTTPVIFVVEGKHRLSGEWVEDVIILAATEDEAIKKAERDGITVSEIRVDSELNVADEANEGKPTRPTQKSTPPSKYPSLEGLSKAYQFVGGLNLIAAIIVCIVGAFQLKNSVEIGWLLIVGTVVYGALSTLVLFAIADGILLAINAASDLSAIRQHLATTQRPSDN